MNKQQFVEFIASKLGGEDKALKALEVVLDGIVRATVEGDGVSITGFGSFAKVDRPAHEARNPQTGEHIHVKKTALPRFRAGRAFRDYTSGAQRLPEHSLAVMKAPKRVRLPGGELVSALSPKGQAELKRRKAKKSTARKTNTKTTAKKVATKKASAAKRTTAKKSAAE